MHTWHVNSNSPCYSTCPFASSQPDAIEKDRLVKELRLWEYRERLGKRAAAVDRRVRASLVLPAQQVRALRRRAAAGL